MRWQAFECVCVCIYHIKIAQKQQMQHAFLQPKNSSKIDYKITKYGRPKYNEAKKVCSCKMLVQNIFFHYLTIMVECERHFGKI